MRFRVGVVLLVLSCAPALPAAAEAAPPANVTPPAIDDTTPVAGQTLHARGDTWDGTQTGVRYQWRRCDAGGAACADIPNATGASYVVGKDDVGSTLRVRAIATNADGSTPSDSAPTGVVGDVPTPPKNTSPPLIAGSPVVGATLVSSIGLWDGTTPIVLTRRWQRCDAGGCADIPSAVSDTYVIQAADLSKRIRMVVRAFNDAGAATAASALLGPVTSGSGQPPPPPPPSPAVASSSVLAAAFTAPREASLGRALAGKLKLGAECTGPCRLLVRLRTSGAVARKWHVPRTLATGRHNLVAAGAAKLRPAFPRTTRLRLRSVKRLVVSVVAEARDGAGKLASRRTSKLTLIRIPRNAFDMSGPSSR